MLPETFLLLMSLLDPGYDGLGRSICGLADVDGDGTPDLALGDPEFETYGAIWVVSGRDGSVLAKRRGDAGHRRLGSSIAASGNELCACVWTDTVPQLLFLSPVSLEATRSVDASSRAQGFHGSVVSIRDVDGDKTGDLLLCLNPRDLKHAFLEVRSGATLRLLRTIERPDWDLSFAPVEELPDVDGNGVGEILLRDECECAPSIVPADHWASVLGCWPNASRRECGLDDAHAAQLADLDGDGVPEFGVSSTAFGNCCAWIVSGRTGALLRQHRGFELGDDLHGLFGTSIVPLGDLDHDRIPDYAIGAGRVTDGFYRGDVFVFSGATGVRLLAIDEASLAHK